jgi:hypothetical protein
MIYVRPSVKRTETIDRVLEQIEPHSEGMILDITSGLRDPAEQLIIIAKYALVNKVRFPEFDPDDVHGRVTIDGQEIYQWQRTWSALLALGIIINPPLAAVVLDDYLRDGVNKKGHLIPGSPHYAGKAFDISGRPGLEKIVGVLQRARAAGAEIKGWLVERKQGAVHVDCL